MLYTCLGCRWKWICALRCSQDLGWMDGWNRAWIQCHFLWFYSHMFHFKSLSKRKAIHCKMKGTKGRIFRWTRPCPSFKLHEIAPFFPQHGIFWKHVYRHAIGIGISTICCYTSYPTASACTTPISSWHHVDSHLHTRVYFRSFKTWRHSPETTGLSR